MSMSLSIDQRVKELLAKMTLAEKIGQMSQVSAGDDNPVDPLRDGLAAGRIGSVINCVDLQAVNEMQRIAVEESRLGIPLLVGRDVIHGFKTILPIPLGQAATWNPQLVEQGARIAAAEAVTAGINWTFAPMVDVSRDARWGRIAESFGEDVYLTNTFSVAMVNGYQGDDLSAADSLAACVKHFAGYGASESGRDYATTNIPENELRNVYLPPFKAAIDAGALTLMTSFSDLNGVPATGNEFLLQQVLRDEWKFEGLVVSDWESITQLAIHGLTENDKDSACMAATAGVDMEMAGNAYASHLEALIDESRVSMESIDGAVTRVLQTKFRLGLFERPFTKASELPAVGSPQSLATARQMAEQSLVLLKNAGDVLPLNSKELEKIAIIGPLADAPYEQLGTWVFDGEPDTTITPLAAIRDMFGNDLEISYVKAMEHSRSRDSAAVEAAVEAVGASDVALLFLGEESILSGEAHCRADISLPGNQAQLVQRIRQSGKPVVAVVMAGRPLTLSNIVEEVDAILFAWHPGTMGGPAIADMLFGKATPSGKLPATFPRAVGQIPIYYNQKNTGKPPSPETVVRIDDIDPFAPQTSLGMTAFHLDVDYTPLFPFGFGLSYTEFEYHNIRTSTDSISSGETLTVSADITNTGTVAAEEVAQLYVRDLVGQVTRPVKELKGFQRVHLQPGETKSIEFELHSDALSFFGRNMRAVTEAGEFHVWVGGNSETSLRTEFRIV